MGEGFGLHVALCAFLDHVIADRAAFDEMRRLSGQTLAPVIEVDGEILADFGADELAVWWKQNQFA